MLGFERKHKIISFQGEELDWGFAKWRSIKPWLWLQLGYNGMWKEINVFVICG